MQWILPGDWHDILQEEYHKPYWKELITFLDTAYQSEKVYPKQEDVFKALALTSYRDTKVVILGQDPYHGEGQAEGLAFSVPKGIKKPPSLCNIFEELHNDIGCAFPENGSLIPWAEQGVLLLNTTLTVREATPKSHANKGWEIFTDAMIDALSKRERPAIFVLWGAHAGSKENRIAKRHPVWKSPHPSPLSAYRGFFGSKPFSRINDTLEVLGEERIHWCLS